jgi:hypothetical protein
LAQAPPELLAMHFAAQLLRIMQHLHAGLLQQQYHSDSQCAACRHHWCK